jgi:signal peptidase I
MAAVLFVGMQFTVQRFAVDGPSMLDNFYTGQQLMVNKIVYHIHAPERGDVVLLARPEVTSEIYIKRIIGLPGESVEIKNGIVYIHQKNGVTISLEEPYVTRKAASDYKGDLIPENEYFVMGDNRNNSSDSRDGWTLPSEHVIGKVWLSVWPMNLFGLIPEYTYAGN